MTAAVTLSHGEAAAILTAMYCTRSALATAIAGTRSTAARALFERRIAEIDAAIAPLEATVAAALAAPAPADALAELVAADREFDAANLSGHCIRIGEAAIRRREAIAAFVD